jgi:hypothetical protein
MIRIGFDSMQRVFNKPLLDQQLFTQFKSDLLPRLSTITQEWAADDSPVDIPKLCKDCVKSDI